MGILGLGDFRRCDFCSSPHSLCIGIRTGQRTQVAPEPVVRSARPPVPFVWVYRRGGLVQGEYPNYSVLSENPVGGQHLGILLVELGVEIMVCR